MLLDNSTTFFLIILGLILATTANIFFWHYIAFRNRQIKPGVSYDEKIEGKFNRVEYKQNSKYVYYRVIVTVKQNSLEKEYASDWINSGPIKNIPNIFEIRISKDNPENYYVDIKYLQEKYFISVTKIAVVLPIFFIVVCLAIGYFYNK